MLLYYGDIIHFLEFRLYIYFSFMRNTISYKRYKTVSGLRTLLLRNTTE